MSHLILHKLFYSMVTCILPPVPGPKIKGFDTHLLEVSSRGREGSVTHCFVIMTWTLAHTIAISSAWQAQSLPSLPCSLAHVFTERWLEVWGSLPSDTRCQRVRRESQENMKIHSSTCKVSITYEQNRSVHKHRNKHFVQITNLERGWIFWLIWNRDPPPPPFSYFH